MATRRTLSGPMSVDGGSQVEVRQVGREGGSEGGRWVRQVVAGQVRRGRQGTRSTALIPLYFSL